VDLPRKDTGVLADAVPLVITLLLLGLVVWLGIRWMEHG